MTLQRRLVSRRLLTAPVNSSRILGIDPSLSSSGYAWRDGSKLTTGSISPGTLRGPYRLFYIRMMIGRLLDVAKPTLVVYEGYAMGARGNNMFHMGELGGVLKVLIWERGIDLLEVPPTTMKSIIGLSGRSEKKDISLALKVRFGISVTQHDEADAVGLMLIGEMKTGLRPADKPTDGIDRFDAIRRSTVIKGKLQLLNSISNAR